jgi:type IV pilus assembly protein PilP
MRKLVVILSVLAVAPLGCGDETVPLPPPGQAPLAAGPAPTATSSAAAGDGDAKKQLPIVEFTDTDFAESAESRDPFRDYSYLYSRKTRTERVVQRKVKASPFSLGELKLVGIITRGRPSVMLTDPNGFGWVLYTGDFVGKPELVSAGGTDGNEVAINWRVDRIRAKDVVFIREDNAHPDIPPTTRVMPLYPAGEEGT